MSASRRYRESIACDLQAREQDRRKEAWICFLFALVVAPAAYVQGTPHWPFAAAGLAFASVWLVATLAKRGRPGRLPRAGRVPVGVARHTTMPSVWLLQHVRDLGDGHEDVKLVGVFSTEEKARAALAQLSTQPGFRDSLAGFAVNRHVVDEVSWAAGFAGAEGWEPGP